MFNAEDRALATKVIHAMRNQCLTLATAESCTGGLISGLLTAVSGSSAVMDRGFVTYSNAAKNEMLGVPKALFAPGGPGAVSESTARAMAEGALAQSRADIAVSVTGIAGPDSDDSNKPVGLVHFGMARRGAGTTHARHEFGADVSELDFDVRRDAIRALSVTTALKMLLTSVSE